MRDKNHILIVGGSSGIGKTTAIHCANKGWIVSVVSRTPDKPPEGAIHFQADVRNPEEFSAALKNLTEHLGHITSLVFFQRFRGEGDSWTEHFRTSMLAIDTSIQLAVPYFKPSGDKSILIISSSASQFVSPEQDAAYHATRAAQLGLMRYHAVHLGPREIRVNCISLGTVLKPGNEQFFQPGSQKRSRCETASPLGRLGTAQEIASAAEFLCSSGASWITGQNLLCDGGASLLWPESLPF